ncbi:integrator complex subunit 13-like, partial [Coregonus clupeaformis]
MKMFSVSHKTAFVVDHCPYMAESSRQQVECDVLTKSRGQGMIPLAPVTKSLWTCAVECSMEYCRILYDVYPLKKLVNYIVSDSEFHILNSWRQEDQSTHEV